MASLKVTKWLGDIPVEGVCTSCPDAQFRPSWNNHRPNKAQIEEKMKQAFGRHSREAHTHEDASQDAARIVREATENK
jgi:ribosome-binding protein aMBF1 (putative translation factor)